MKGFTLVEMLIVLGIIALGWWWVPSLMTGTAIQPQNHFEAQLQEFTARARMEAIARGQNVAFALIADGSQMAIGIDNSGNFQPLSSIAVDPSIAFDKNLSSVAGNPGIFTFENDTAGNFWRLWWFDANGKPIQINPLLVWDINNQQKEWMLANEGALMEIQN